MLNGNPFAGVGRAAGGGAGSAVVPAPVLPWICDCAGTLLPSLVVETAKLATASLADVAASLCVALLDALDADTRVCMVLAPDDVMEPSWNGGGAGAFIGNEPAGQLHLQAQPPLLAACSALVMSACPPAPALTVTAAPPEDFVEVAETSPLLVPLPDPEPAMTVTPPDDLLAEALLPPDPASTVTAAGGLPAFADVALPPTPASTVIAAGGDPASTVIAAGGDPAFVDVAFDPDPASTVIAAGGAPAELPPAETVTPAAMVLLAEESARVKDGTEVIRANEGIGEASALFP